MEYVALVSALALLQHSFIGFRVGQAHQKYGIQPPAMAGNPDFERVKRAAENTTEQLIVVLPAMWLFGWYVHELSAAVLGLIYVVSRIFFFRGYCKSAEQRNPWFVIGWFASMILLLGSIGGLIWRWV